MLQILDKMQFKIMMINNCMFWLFLKTFVNLYKT